MKKLRFVAICIVTCLFSCNQEAEENFSDVKMPDVSYTDLRLSSQKFILEKDSNALHYISTYMMGDEKVMMTRSAYKECLTFDTIQFKRFMDEHALDSDESLEKFLEENPEEIDVLIQSTCSAVFCKYFMEIPRINSPELEEEFCNAVFTSKEMTNQEKAFLFLIYASENGQVQTTRSVKSCIKRYIKLTTISVNALRITLVDIQSGVEYATRELKGMDKSYDC